MTINLTKSICTALVLAALSACSSAPAVVRTGDKVEVGFTCRLPDGQLAATTRPDNAVSAERKSPFYAPYRGKETVVLTAGGQTNDPARDRLSFEEEIMKRLSPSLTGLKEGQHVVTELQADRYPAASPTDRFVQLAKVRKRLKEMRLSREEYTTRTGKDPEAGQRFVIDPLVPGRVSEVTSSEVVVRFAPAMDKPMILPFGPVTVRENDTHYELEIDAVQGRLVRTGGMAGRISAVEDDSFSIDYGHPFGGERLNCDVAVESVTQIANQNPAVASADDKGGATKPAHVAVSNSSLDPAAEKVLKEGLARMLTMSNISAVSGAVARSGDLVTANYTVTLEDGTLVATTLGAIASDQAVRKVPWYREPAGYTPVELVAGKQEVMPGLAEALVGMQAGQKQRITLTPDKTFGPPDPQKTQQLPCSQTFPKVIRMPADEYFKRFSSFPSLNKEVELLPYFKSRVTEVTERDVALEFLVADGASFKDSFGSVDVIVAGDRITTTIKPQPGAPFPIKDGVGIVSATDGMTFTVDFNHPLAGKTIVLELEAVSVVPSTGPAGGVDWIDDYEAGLGRARQEGKPVFMILHADWCGWCKKSFDETIPDPRIMALKDRFVWVRVNSDKEQKYKKQYGQDGFPMMVLLNPEGTVLKKIDGYRDARALREEIRAVLN